MKDRPFAIIDGTPAPDTALERLHAKKPPDLVRCRCGSNSFISARMGLTYNRAKRPTGGRKVLICTLCLANGRHVIIG